MPLNLNYPGDCFPKMKLRSFKLKTRSSEHIQGVGLLDKREKIRQRELTRLLLCQYHVVLALRLRHRNYYPGPHCRVHRSTMIRHFRFGRYHMRVGRDQGCRFALV